MYLKNSIAPPSPLQSCGKLWGAKLEAHAVCLASHQVHILLLLRHYGERSVPELAFDDAHRFQLFQLRWVLQIRHHDVQRLHVVDRPAYVIAAEVEFPLAPQPKLLLGLLELGRITGMAAVEGMVDQSLYLGDER